MRAKVEGLLWDAVFDAFRRVVVDVVVAHGDGMVHVVPAGGSHWR